MNSPQSETWCKLLDPNYLPFHSMDWYEGSQFFRLSEKLMRSFNELWYFWFVWILKYIKYENTLNLLKVVTIIWLFHQRLFLRFIHRSLLMIHPFSSIRRFVEEMNWETSLFIQWGNPIEQKVMFWNLRSKRVLEFPMFLYFFWSKRREP